MSTMQVEHIKNGDIRCAFCNKKVGKTGTSITSNAHSLILCASCAGALAGSLMAMPVKWIEATKQQETEGGR